MSIHLVGGGGSAGDAHDLYHVFLSEAAERAQTVPRIAVILLGTGDGAAVELRLLEESFDRAVAGTELSFELVPVLVAAGEQVEARSLAGIHAVMVGGGLTPAYQQALVPVVGEIRRLVADGMPYLGFSAGAALAADRAIIGGWQIGGVPVCPEPTSEGLDEVTLAEGIGLIDVAVDAHAAQWGTLGRLVAATEADLIGGGLAIDEGTVLIIGEGPLRVAGRGSVWQVTPGEMGVVVRTMAA